MQDSPANDPVKKYRFKLKTEGRKEEEQEVEIDTKNEIEAFHVPKTSPDREQADVVLDFKKVSAFGALHVRFTKYNSAIGFQESMRRTRAFSGRGDGRELMIQ